MGAFLELACRRSMLHTQARTLFTQFDADRSGGLDQAEVMVALNALGLQTDPAQAAAILSRYDAYGNGRLEVGEFVKLHEELCDFFSTSQKAQLAPRDDVSRMFETFDVDNSQAIEARELLAALRSLWLPSIDAAEASQIFNRYDTDGNGRLDADEFRRLVEDLRQYIRSSRS